MPPPPTNLPEITALYLTVFQIYSGEKNPIGNQKVKLQATWEETGKDMPPVKGEDSGKLLASNPGGL